MIFDQQLKITFRKSSGPLKKSTPPFLLTPPPPPENFKKCKSPPFCQHSKFFSSSPGRKVGEDTVVILQDTYKFSGCY